MASNAPIAAAGTVLQIDGETVAKITALRRSRTLQEEETTGTEDYTGNLVNEQYLPVSVNDTVEFEYVTMSGAGEGTPQQLEPGQDDIETAMEAATSVALAWTKPTGYGWTLTGFITGLTEGFSSPKGIYTGSGTFRVNSKSEITP